jgi:hypothetical protein
LHHMLAWQTIFWFLHTWRCLTGTCHGKFVLLFTLILYFFFVPWLQKQNKKGILSLSCRGHCDLLLHVSKSNSFATKYHFRYVLVPRVGQW